MMARLACLALRLAHQNWILRPIGWTDLDGLQWAVHEKTRVFIGDSQ